VPCAAAILPSQHKQASHNVKGEISQTHQEGHGSTDFSSGLHGKAGSANASHDLAEHRYTDHA